MAGAVARICRSGFIPRRHSPPASCRGIKPLLPGWNRSGSWQGIGEQQAPQSGRSILGHPAAVADHPVHGGTLPADVVPRFLALVPLVQLDFSLDVFPVTKETSSRHPLIRTAIGTWLHFTTQQTGETIDQNWRESLADCASLVNTYPYYLSFLTGNPKRKVQVVAVQRVRSHMVWCLVSYSTQQISPLRYSVSGTTARIGWSGGWLKVSSILTFRWESLEAHPTTVLKS